MSLYEEFRKLSEDEIAHRVKGMVDNNWGEDQQLDFKRIESLNFLLKKSTDKTAKKEDFSHDLSMFANAQGGVIIYGIEEQKNDQGKREMIRFNKGFDVNLFSKDQLIQIANTCIEPALAGIDVKSFEHPDNPNEKIILVLIPETQAGAIMAVAKEKDFRYYQRVGTEKKVMRDWQIRLINNKLVHPDVQLEFDVEKGIYFSFFENKSEPLDFSFFIKAPLLVNKGKIVTSKVGVNIKISKELYNKRSKMINGFCSTTNTNDNYNGLKIIEFPIFPNLKYNLYNHNDYWSFKLSTADFQHPIHNFSGKIHEIEFLVYADNAPVKTYKIILDLLNISNRKDLKEKGLELPNTDTCIPGIASRQSYIKDIPEILKFEDNT